jgi:ectoine hydroxylase-related dioxygenase (phytanoyl-CoA dioxygenase family)
MSMHASSSQIAPSAREQYHSEGYLVLRDVFQPREVAALAGEAMTLLARGELIDTANLRCRWADHVETGECMFDCFDPVIDIGPVSRFVARDERILAPLRAIYGEDAFLFKDKLIFKRPGAKGYALHQDYISWPEFPTSFITVILAIDPTDRSNGATEVFPGCHKGGLLSKRDGDYHELPPTLLGDVASVSLDLQPGDIALFDGMMPHASAPNRSDRWRRQLYLSYNASSDGGDLREAHYRQFHEWLRKKYAEFDRGPVFFH